MSVAEIGQLHSRYVRLADRFKTLWTYHQFASGVFLNLLAEQLPYEIDFQAKYEPVKRVADALQTAESNRATEMMNGSDQELRIILGQLMEADERIPTNVMRRFFEKVRQQDEKIIFYLIKFYLFGDIVTGDRKDKLDFLFTKIAEEFIEERGEYASRDSLELRKKFHSLLLIRPAKLPTQEQAAGIIRHIRGLKEEIEQARTFEDLAEKELLEKARNLKHDIGDGYFHPDVLLAVVQCNVGAKNRFKKLFADEEDRLVSESARLIENEQAITRGFRASNPEILDEMERFKQHKLEFDESRAVSNVKFNVIANLKASMNRILTELEHELDDPGEIPEAAFKEARKVDLVRGRFGDDAVLYNGLAHIVSTLQTFPDETMVEQMMQSLEVEEMRLEAWEIESCLRLYRPGVSLEAREKDHCLLYLRAAALRLKIDTEATHLAELGGDQKPGDEFSESVRQSLERAKELDAQFKAALQEGIHETNPRTLHNLYRSRLRLLRVFSGLWLIHDQISGRRY